MLVVSDTSPLNYLILVDAIHVLPTLFVGVVAPPTVIEELSHQRSPKLVQKWASSPPAWLRVQRPKTLAVAPGLHRGEAEAIALAEELSAEAILVDDRLAKREALRRGIYATGTLGVLARAAVERLVDVEMVARKLRETNFRGDVNLLDELLKEFRHGHQRPDLPG